MAEVTYGVELDTRDFNRRLQDTSGRLTRFSQTGSSTLRNFSRRATLALTAVTGGFVALSKASIQAADDQAKAARSAGLTFERYQELAQVFDLTGVGAGQLSRTMTQLAQQLGNARSGLSSPQVALAQLNLTIEEFQGLDLEESFLRVIEAARQQSDVTLRQAGLNLLLGRSARNAGTLIGTSADEVQRLRDRLRDLGGVVPDNVALFAENLNDEIATLNRVIRTQFLVGLEDGLRALTEYEGRDDGIRQIGEAVSSLTSAFTSLGVAIGRSTALQGVVTAITTIAERIADILEDLEDLSNLSDQIAQGTPPAELTPNQLDLEIGTLSQQISTLSSEFEDTLREGINTVLATATIGIAGYSIARLPVIRRITDTVARSLVAGVAAIYSGVLLAIRTNASALRGVGPASSLEEITRSQQARNATLERANDATRAIARTAPRLAALLRVATPVGLGITALQFFFDDTFGSFKRLFGSIEVGDVTRERLAQERERIEQEFVEESRRVLQELQGIEDSIGEGVRRTVATAQTLSVIEAYSDLGERVEENLALITRAEQLLIQRFLNSARIAAPDLTQEVDRVLEEVFDDDRLQRVRVHILDYLNESELNRAIEDRAAARRIEQLAALRSQNIAIRTQIAGLNQEISRAIFGTFDLLDDVADTYVTRANRFVTESRRAGQVPFLDQESILGGIDTTNFLQPPTPGIFSEVSNEAWQTFAGDLGTTLQQTAPRFSRLWEDFAVSFAGEATSAILDPGRYDNVGEALARIFAQIFLQAALQAAATSALTSLGLIGSGAGAAAGAPPAHDGTIVPSGPDRIYRLRALETVRTPEQEANIQRRLNGEDSSGDQFIFAPQIMGEYTEAERARLSRELRNFYGQFEQEGGFVRQRNVR